MDMGIRSTRDLQTTSKDRNTTSISAGTNDLLNQSSVEMYRFLALIRRKTGRK